MSTPSTRERVLFLRITCLLACVAVAGLAAGQSQPGWTSAQPPVTTADERELATAIAAAPSDGRDAVLAASPVPRTHGLVVAIVEEGQRLDLKTPATALDLYRVAAGVATGIGDIDGETFAMLSAGVTDGRQGNYDSAMARFLDVERKAQPAGLGVRVAQSLANQGILHRRRGDADLALGSYQRALALTEQARDLPRQGVILNNLGSLAIDLGNYRAALGYYQRSLAIKQETKAADLGTTLVNIGVVYVHQGDQDLALDYYRRGLEASERIGNTDSVASACNNIGQVHASRGEHARAIEYFEKVLAITNQANLRWQAARTTYNIAVVLRSQGKWPEALATFRRALELREQISDRPGIAESLTEIADTLLLLDQPADGMDAAARAVTMARDGGNLGALWLAQSVLARCREAAGDMAGAERAYGDAIVTVDSMRGLVAGGAQQRQQFFETRQNPYERLASLLVRQRRDVEALAVAEGAKARVLLDVLQGGSIDVTKAMTDDEREQERHLRRAVTLANSELSAARARPAPEAGGVAALAGRVEAARREQAEFQTRLFSAHPNLRVQRGDVAVVTSADLAALLPSPRSLAIEFHVTAQRTFVFIVAPDQAGASVRIAVHTIPVSRDDLAGRTRQFRQRLAARDLDLVTLSREMYDLLLGPCARELAAATELIIVPDGALWELPFQALKMPDGRYLIEQASVAYAPSLSVLREMRRSDRGRRAARGSFVLGGFGSSGTPPGAAVAGDATVGPMPALIEAERQTVAIGKIYGPLRSQVFVGSGARRERLASGSARYQIVHVAAHAVLDDASPLHSYLVMAPRPGEPQDAGLLEAADVMRLNLSADLVVLSACDTGRGRVGAGEGLIGMSWSLFVAGVPSAVVSQWQVDSASTTALMVAFHRRINGHLIKTGTVGQRAEALRQAALTMLRSGTYTHPFYWAPFVVMGDGR